MGPRARVLTAKPSLQRGLQGRLRARALLLAGHQSFPAAQSFPAPLFFNANVLGNVLWGAQGPDVTY